MFPRSSIVSGPRPVVPLQSVRYARRKPEYPRYRAQLAPLTHPKKDHSGFFRRHMKAWLGPKNLRGEYHRNKYYYPPQDHKPNYIVPDGNPVDLGEGTQAYARLDDKRDPSLHPFPHNTHTKTGLIVSDELKQKIYSEATEEHTLAQELAHKYGLKLSRVEAIIRLQTIEKSWREKGLLSENLEQFSGVMKKMFPLFNPNKTAENLTEIPTPSKTLHQRFLTISESEPFGPVDASKIFDLEPAQKVLDNLTELQDTSETRVVTNKVLVGQQKAGDKVQFRFTMSTSGNVGYRYGASRRDRKKDRAISFDKLGRMVYTV
ncbi:hypothetical protein METBIDRAFT_35415 [Metschnikowia bicuspidata var. bicuspidata NRRL YB-4993]|uniref:37S ribosomal protein S35, mitochondrial n=1 Tax=Metschnikowia bicuspidata var. bicuspidata NRRL YB-4993 TaxID=869754 RepID=A0A1A0HKD8_9ASCO|nr:hypothetical protein METBIDRAFT_35415 [Metschnikowia bicuspidata var. bicuspidata NRRL YB-4993]OBA24352.1 hypothetical protein METBIDRAFT_35415 [Metschnikowia bicuspidata var. bicuspidata NRRL YB-4993]